MGAETVIAMYKPHEGKDAALRALIRRHVPTLRELELITDMPALLLQAEDGTYLEIFEWVDEGADKSHEHPAIARIWEAMGAVADFVTLGNLAEAAMTFPHFARVVLDEPGAGDGKP